jgi:hypothetical protein
MKRYWAVAGMVAVAIAAALNATTINGVANQIISSWTQHAVVLGGGSGDPTVAAPGTSGYPLVSNGSSTDPSFQTVPNTGLTNSSVTIATSGCISGGGSVSLGATLTLSTSCAGFNGVTSTTPGATPTWTLQSGDVAWTLSANATATVAVVAGDKWVPHHIQICQPASGGPYTFAWPANVKGGMTIGATASKCNMQTLESFDGTNLYATGTGVINQ